MGKVSQLINAQSFLRDALVALEHVKPQTRAEAHALGLAKADIDLASNRINTAITLEAEPLGLEAQT